MVSKGSPAVRPIGGWVFLHGVHVERGAADLFGWTRERCRRSAQGSEQSRRPGDRDRFALSTRVFPAGNRCARPAAGPLSIQRPWPIADQPVARAKWRMVAPVDRLSRREALDTHLAGAGGPDEIVSARYERSCEYSGESRHYHGIIRGRSGVASEAGNGPWNRRLAASDCARSTAGGVPPQ